MIYGIGHDIVQNRRISNLLSKFGDRFVRKILSHEELLFIYQKPDPTLFLAKRFEAKEAFGKACGIGIRYPILLTEITIINDSLGKPVFRFGTVVEKWLLEHKIRRCHLSISDETNLSSAFVILESNID